MDFLQLNEITAELLINTAEKFEGGERRIFMAEVVNALGPDGQRKAERELGWNRGTIRKGMQELETGIIIDNRSATGRKKSEEHLPDLIKDIKSIVDPHSHVDPTFRTTQLYIPLTAGGVRQLLIEEKGYTDEELPTERTIANKLNELNYRPQKVTKSKPIKKNPETDAIFDQLHKINPEADAAKGVIRISIDAKADIKIGPFSRCGYNRGGIKGSDHDFDPDSILKLFGIYLPAYDQQFFFFSKSKVTPDFMIDALENIWPEIEKQYNPHTLVINSDNGPECNSHRTQFMKRIVEFACGKGIKIILAYYPPYHSKYNPVERVWGILEKHWNGEILDSVDKVLGFARTMKWNGNNPVVQMVKGTYETGVKVGKKAMEKYEAMIKRLPGLEKWFVVISPQAA
jgi:hypothetical protein